MKKFFNWYAHKLTKHPKTVFGIGIMIAIVIIIAGFGFGGTLSNEAMSISGTPATKAAKIANKHFKNPNNGAQAQVVLKSKDKLTSNANQKKLVKMQNELTKESGVKLVLSPVQQQNLAQKAQVGYFTVIYQNKTITKKQSDELKKVADKYRSNNFKVELSGTASSVEVSEAPEIVGLSIALVILIITFSAFLAAGLPILATLIGLVAGLGGLFFVAKYANVASYDISLAAMIALAVGIDYALFLVSRFRDERKHLTVDQVMVNTLTTTGPSVVFAAVTIVVALLSISTLGIGFLGVMGNVAALTVVISVLLNLIITPSILRIFPCLGQSKLKHQPKNSSKYKPVKLFTKAVHNHSLITALVAILVLIGLALPVNHMQLGLPNDGSKQTSTTERRAYDIKAKAYGAGNDATLVALVENDKNSVTAKILFNKVNRLANIKKVGQPILATDGKYLMVTIIPKIEANSHATQKLVNKVRALKINNHKIMVTEVTAVNIDISARLSAALPKFLLIIVGFAFLLLMVALRSFLLPLMAVIGFVLSLLASLGVVVLTIQDGHFANLLNLLGKTAILNFLPVLLVGILFGLAMDYEVFLVQRIYEEHLKFGTTTKEAVQREMTGTGSSVIAAALIMTAVFASFTFTDEIIIQSMGLALAAGVFINAFIVRMLLVPALINIFGKANWYFPKWLDNILPKI